jgi:hypothetical protein
MRAQKKVVTIEQGAARRRLCRWFDRASAWLLLLVARDGKIYLQREKTSRVKAILRCANATKSGVSWRRERESDMQLVKNQAMTWRKSMLKIENDT